MALKLKDGVYALNAAGLPEEIGGLEELLQNLALRLNLPQGSFPYDRALGSRLHRLDLTREHAAERARAFAEEALLGLPGVEIAAVAVDADSVRFTVNTPLGSGEVRFEKGGNEDGDL